MSKQTIGPTLPPNWRPDDNKDTKEEEEEDSGDDVYGPALPPSLQTNQTKTEVIGPTLPPHLQHLAQVEDDSSDDQIQPSDMRSTEPSRSRVDDSDSSCDEAIGPLPESHHSYDKINEKFGDCSHVLAKNESNKQMRLEREEWMSMAPAKLAPAIPTKSVKHFSQRSSKHNDKTRDSDKYKKNTERDKELTKLMDSYNKNQKRDVSLIDVHREELSKKKKVEKKVEERVPFDPEKDLAVRRMNAKQTESVLNKAKTFNDRFSLGVNKFL